MELFGLQFHLHGFFRRTRLAQSRVKGKNLPFHGLTAGTATRMLLPWLSSEAAEIALRYGWQLAAAFYAAMVLEPPAATCDAGDIAVEDLVGEALDCGDEHAIKTLEVCLAAYRRRPDPVHLVAARETTRALGRTGLSLA